MNGIEKITARILSEAETAAAGTIAEAEKKAEAVRADYGKKAADAYASRMEAGQNALRTDAERTERAAGLEERSEMLAVKQKILSQTYDLAREKLLAMPREKYIDFLAGQASRAAVTGREEIILNERDRAVGEDVKKRANALLAERSLPGELTLSSETGNFSGGLKLRSGSVETNCTVDTMLQLSRSRLDADAAAMLFL